MRYLKILSFLLLSLGLTALISSSHIHRLFALEHIEVQSDAVQNQSLVLAMSEILQKELSALKSVNLFQVDVDHVAAVVMSQPWVSSFHVQKVWPNRLAIRISLHEPMALLRTKKKWFVLNEKGQLLPLLITASSLDRPLLLGDAFAKQSELRAQAVEFLKALPTEGPVQVGNVSEIRFEPRAGFVVTLKENPARVELGRDSWKVKAARAGQVIDYLQTRQLEARVINTNLSKKVLVRLRKDP